MKLLFIHQNFPGQYKHLVPALLKRGHRIVALGETPNLKRQEALWNTWEGLRVVGYPTPKGCSDTTHRYLRSAEGDVRRGQAVARLGLQLRHRDGFVPDVICAHPGWGEALFLKDVWPEARLLSYQEFFYSGAGADIGFDPEFPSALDDLCRARIRNTSHLITWEASDWGISPTRWQRSRFPAFAQPRISVIHDGVDTHKVTPNPAAQLRLGRVAAPLTRDDEVITFTARNLEPYRGIHSFLRALPEIQRLRPKARIVVVGGDEVSYGRKLKSGDPSYRQRYLAEVVDRLDMSRIHFVGKIPYQQLIRVFQLSSAHVYLTYPFVLSWSMLEAMAAGCLVIGSRTAPVEEVIDHGVNGLLVDFFSPPDIAAAVDRALCDRAAMEPLRERARQSVVERFDLQSVCLPRQIDLLETLAAGGTPPAVDEGVEVCQPRPVVVGDGL
ncbi:MAG: glycosyltransferase family 4 protein [Candidatus Competibacterales bacterium]